MAKESLMEVPLAMRSRARARARCTGKLLVIFSQ